MPSPNIQDLCRARRVFPKNSRTFSLVPKPSWHLAWTGVKEVFGTVLLIPKGITVILLEGTLNSADLLGSLRVDEDMISKEVLDPERYTVERRNQDRPVYPRSHCVR